jgi:hypothetical protein
MVIKGNSNGVPKEKKNPLILNVRFDVNQDLIREKSGQEEQ